MLRPAPSLAAINDLLIFKVLTGFFFFALAAVVWAVSGTSACCVVVA